MDALEFLDGWFGEPLEQVEAGRLRLPPDQGFELLNEVRLRHATPSEHPANYELWPIFTPRTRARTRWSRFDVPTWLPGKNWLGALVYAHGVTLPDPLDELVRDVGDRPLTSWRERQYLELLADAIWEVRTVAPLVREHAVHFYPLRELYKESLSLAPRVDTHDEFGIIPTHRGLDTIASAHSLALAFRMAEGGLGQPLVDREQFRLLELTLQDGAVFDQAVSDRVNTVISAALPRLRGISVENMIAMRRDGEAFAEWRIALSRALTQSMAMRCGEIGGPALADSLRSALLDEIEPARRKIHKEISRSRIFASSLTEPAALGILSAGAGVAVGTQTAEAIAPAALVSVGGALTNYVRRRRSAQKNAAMIGFYTLMGAGR